MRIIRVAEVPGVGPEVAALPGGPEFRTSGGQPGQPGNAASHKQAHAHILDDAFVAGHAIRSGITEAACFLLEGKLHNIPTGGTAWATEDDTMMDLVLSLGGHFTYVTLTCFGSVEMVRRILSDWTTPNALAMECALADYDNFVVMHKEGGGAIDASTLAECFRGIGSLEVTLYCLAHVATAKAGHLVTDEIVACACFSPSPYALVALHYLGLLPPIEPGEWHSPPLQRFLDWTTRVPPPPPVNYDQENMRSSSGEYSGSSNAESS